jgi:hypothetical protein
MKKWVLFLFTMKGDDSMYTPAQTAAMNKQGAAYLKSKGKDKKGNSITPQFDKLKGMSSDLPTNQMIKSMSGQTYNPPSNTAPLGNQKVGGSSTPDYSKMPDWLDVGTGMAPQSTVPETEKPDWLPDEDMVTYGGSGSGSYQDILDAIAEQEKKQKDLQLSSLRSAFDKSRQDYEAKKPEVQQSATNMRNLTDTNYFTQGLPSLFAAMEAAGQRGGENITGRVTLDAARGQSLNAADLFENTQLANINNAILGLGTQQAQDEANILSGISADASAQRLAALKDAMSMDLQNLNTAKSDFENTVGAFGDNYQAEINRLTQLQNQGMTADGGVSIAYKIAALNRERNQKKLDQQIAASKATQTAEENAQAWARIYNAMDGGGSSMTGEQALQLYIMGDRSPAVLKALGLQ